MWALGVFVFASYWPIVSITSSYKENILLINMMRDIRDINLEVLNHTPSYVFYVMYLLYLENFNIVIIELLIAMFSCCNLVELG